MDRQINESKRLAIKGVGGTVGKELFVIASYRLPAAVG